MTPDQVAQYGPYAFLAYIFVVHALPKLAPELTKIITKRVTVQDRLFATLDYNRQAATELIVTLTKLQGSLDQMTQALVRLDDRVTHIEQTMLGGNEKIWLTSSRERTSQAS
jgi:hypothetical protein